jgi:hypothetical protein
MLLQNTHRKKALSIYFHEEAQYKSRSLVLIDG